MSLFWRTHAAGVWEMLAGKQPDDAAGGLRRTDESQTLIGLNADDGEKTKV